MQHKILYAIIFSLLCTQLSASQKVYAPQQKVEQEIINSLDEEVASDTKITLRNLYNEVIEVPRSWLQHSKMLATALETDPEETEIKLPRITSTQALDDIFRALMVLDKISANPCVKKAHEIMFKLDTMEKSVASVEIIQKDLEELCALPGIEREFNEGLKTLQLSDDDKIQVLQIFLNFDLEVRKNIDYLDSVINLLVDGSKKLDYKFAKEKRTWQDLKELKKILRFVGLKKIVEVFKLSESPSHDGKMRLLDLYASAQYLGIPVLVEYISPLVASIVLENYFDSECNYIIRNFDPAWESHLKLIILNGMKKTIEEHCSSLTPLYILKHFKRVFILNIFTAQGEYGCYTYGEHGIESVWNLKNGCLEHCESVYRVDLFNRDWTQDSKYFAVCAGGKSVKVYEVKFDNLSLEQIAFIRMLLTPSYKKIAIAQHKNLYQSLPEHWKKALEPEKTQLIPLNKWKAYLYSFPPFMRKAFYGTVGGAIGIATLAMWWKFKKRA